DDLKSEGLAGPLISALDIAKEAHIAQNAMEATLRHIDTMLEVKRALARPAEDIAASRGNRAIVLCHLGRFGEAKVELEACLQVFQHDSANRAMVLSCLANLFYEQGDVPSPITHQRGSLALSEQLPYP